jgi:hypothetical protein
MRQVGGFSPGTLVSSTNKTDLHDITDILLKVAFNTINHQTTETCITVHECSNIPKVAKVGSKTVMIL